MSLQIAMPLFLEKPRLSAEKLQAAFTSNWPDLPPASDISEKDDILSFSLGQAEVHIATMPAPFPWSDLEGPCATSILWPDASTEVAAHKVHAIVAVRGELSPIELSTSLTQVTAALMASSPESIGVYWSNATIVIPRDLFFDFAVEVLPSGPPLPIWVDYRVGWADEQATVSSGFTTGLATLGLMELEARNATEPPSELRDRFEAIAGYLIENGLVVQDGDTIGESADEKIRVDYSESTFGATGTVMRLSYEAA